MVRQRFVEALAYAIDAHRGQVRKSTEIPYVSHPMAVCALVLEDGGSEDEAVAALLHDVAEDQGGEAALNEIGARFGLAIRSLVSALSDDLPPAGGEKREWRERKEQYMAHLRQAPISVLRVSLADKLHNARSIAVDRDRIGDAVWDRFSADAEQQRWYYGSLLAIFEERLPDSRNVPEFRRAIQSLG